MNTPFHGLRLPELGRNIGNTMLRQLSVVALGFGLVVFLARMLGPQGMGQYTLALLLPTLLSALLNLGVAPANVYFISRRTVTPWDALKGSFLLWFFLVSIGVVVAVPVIYTLGRSIFPGVPTQLLLAVLMVFPVALLLSFISSLLQGMQDFKRYNKVLVIAPAATLILAAILVWVFGSGLKGALWAYGLGQLLGLTLAFHALRSHLHRDDSRMPAKHYARYCFGYGWKAHLSNIMSFINYRADVFLVNFFISPAAAGVYVIAVQIAERLWMLSQAAGTVILPRLSELEHNEDHRRRLTPLMARWIFLLTLLSTAVLVLAGTVIINMLFGPEYSKAYTALLWLLPGVAFSSVARVLANDLAARGRPELNIYTALLVVIVNITGNIVLIPKLGINGAAVATTISYSVNAAAKLYLYARISGNVWWEPVLVGRIDYELVKSGARLFLKNSKPTYPSV